MAKRVLAAFIPFLALVLVIIGGLLLDDGTRVRPLLLSSSNRQHDIRTFDEQLMRSPTNASLKSDAGCTKQTNIVFVKTHKTASTTTAGIFDLFALKNNLTVAAPPDGQAFMDRHELFNRKMVAKSRKSAEGWQKKDGFNVFSCHARYNRPEMDAVVHNAKYITILRDPASQFTSAFVYFHFDSRLTRKLENIGIKYDNVIKEFMKRPEKYMKMFTTNSLVHVLRNQQFFDLGFDTWEGDNWDLIHTSISKLSHELDLVLITEYYDESLILLRKFLCWSMDDILYTKRQVKNSTSAIKVDQKTKDKIRKWNAADMALYQHFNRTLWRRIAEYGPTFNADLQEFRRRLKGVDDDETGRHRVHVNQIVRRMKTQGIYV